MPKCDVLVIGSGLAGLTFSIKFAEKFPDKSVTVITKADESESNTKYAQGGIAVVLDELSDSFQQHIDDTLKAGAGLGDLNVIETVVKEGPDRLKEIISWGAHFDETPEGDLDLGLEGGHSANRIVHHKDITGFEMESTLLRKIKQLKNLKLLSHHFAIDLITEHQVSEKVKKYEEGKKLNCYGAYVLNQKTDSIETFQANYTILASGGIGQVYKTTTNPLIATGDGIAMAYRAKAKLKDMEFVQFHPTALYKQGENPSFLISEAVRGFGAYLRNRSGKRFMFKYDDRGELASRDIVAKAIDREMKRLGDECVYLDCKHLDQKKFKEHFPNILNKCIESGIDPFKDLIPVAPAAHYVCGGIDVDLNGRTNINNLYACGECSRTGLHGANRLASNSLLEALVFAHRCFIDISKKIPDTVSFKKIPEWNADLTVPPEELVLITCSKNELKTLMTDYVGIVRSEERLNRALRRLKVMYEETSALYKKLVISTQLCELRNMIDVCYVIVKSSANRSENVGGYYNIDLEEEELQD
ncbi:L-aspartate oxidase [Marinigracilibium pacificum]|uniref:L-aspartate oxidase n=1 Tax=Marinigracilibium pacificum TaxID=2729599 RepID=A0A848IXD3_9BACT|nr:L-aspartate oxidase [Marinigracilibium pacificum]NMM49193.1 L-aspartate oxidase [Marinigracilibium pacificum]